MPPARSAHSNDLQFKNSHRSASCGTSNRPSKQAECPIQGCGRKLSRKGDLPRHMESKHPEHLDYEVQSHDCPFAHCGFTTKQKSNLTPHMLGHLGTEYIEAHECPYVGCDSYTSLSAYSSPTLRHAAKCNFKSNAIKEHLQSRWYIDDKGKLRATTPKMKKKLEKNTEEGKAPKASQDWTHSPASPMFYDAVLDFTQDVDPELSYDTVPASKSDVLTMPLQLFAPISQTDDNFPETNAALFKEQVPHPGSASQAFDGFTIPSMSTPLFFPWSYDSELVPLINNTSMMAPAVFPCVDFSDYAHMYSPFTDQQLCDQMDGVHGFATSVPPLFSQGDLQPSQAVVFHPSPYFSPAYSIVPPGANHFADLPTSLHFADPPSFATGTIYSELPGLHPALPEGLTGRFRNCVGGLTTNRLSP